MANLKSIAACEQRKIDKLKKYQLPNTFKKIGIIIAVFSFVLLMINGFFIDNLIIREATKYTLLIGMLIISISKEKIEDERIAQLRMQSYTVAFIAGVILALFQPFANILVDFLLGASEPAMKDTGDFVTLWTLLSVQLFYFELLKYRNR